MALRQIERGLLTKLGKYNTYQRNIPVGVNGEIYGNNHYR